LDLQTTWRLCAVQQARAELITIVIKSPDNVLGFTLRILYYQDFVVERERFVSARSLISNNSRIDSGVRWTRKRALVVFKLFFQ